MQDSSIRENLKGRNIHFVGAKGTGMTAIAELFAFQGAILSGSDVADTFYTDAILQSIGMKVCIGFSPENIPSGTDFIVFSDAYGKDTNPELIEATHRGIPTISFAEALGMYSRLSISSAVAGVHGKTTTTALVGTLLKEMEAPATVLAGSAVTSFDGHCTMVAGNRYFIAETDEYRGHFFHYSPSRILLTSVESDHQDYYPTYESILSAFIKFCELLPKNGVLIYCADDPGACEVVSRVKLSRIDVHCIPYGLVATGDWKITNIEFNEGVNRFSVQFSDSVFETYVPGKHVILDAVGALALSWSIGLDYGIFKNSFIAKAVNAFKGFRGSKRRSEIVGTAGGVLFIDDYAHHPTAIRTTIAGFKKFWPSRRLIIDFMSHTFSRTQALMEEFASSFEDADCIILHDIYSSAREKPIPGISGRILFERTKEYRKDLKDITFTHGIVSDSDVNVEGFILYIDRHQDGIDVVKKLLRENDIFITMGAGDNWKLGRSILESIATGA
jgi:UDP-N-acetylmuramate--alanine ligase